VLDVEAEFAGVTPEEIVERILGETVPPTERAV